MSKAPIHPDDASQQRDRLRIMKSIERPRDFECLNANGVFTAFGAHSEDLTGVWAAVFPGPDFPDVIPPNPLDLTEPAVVSGTFDPGPPKKWTVSNIPGARSACNIDLFVVWFWWPGAPDYDMTSKVFKGVDPGQTCSGMSGSCPGGGGSTAFSSSFIAEPGPREYELQLAYAYIPTAEPLKSLLAGAIPTSAHIDPAVARTHTPANTPAISPCTRPLLARM